MFPEPPMIAFKRQRNLRSSLIRAKVYPNQSKRDQRNIKGMYKCLKQCPNCPFIKTTKQIAGPNFTWTLNGKFTCKTSNVIYMVECKKDNCKARYIGQTKREMSERFAEHRGYVNNKELDKPTGHHFNQPGHDISNMQVTILQKLKGNSNELYRKEREKYLINKFNTFKEGMNKQP